MKRYEKPMLIVNEEYAEGIYTVSGDTDHGSLKCNSKYVNGVFHASNYNNTSSYIERFGCNGCPAFRFNGCGLQIEGYWGSYDSDLGNRYPNWEKIGHEPYDPINWDDVGSC